jgi:hypothetical protein
MARLILLTATIAAPLLFPVILHADGRHCGLVESIFAFDGEIGPAPAPAPDPTPSPYKCKYCKDTKVIIHGDGHTTPCPHCQPTTVDEKPKIILSSDYKMIKIDGTWHKRKPAMSGTGQWVGVNIWSQCMGGYCRPVEIKDEKQLGFDPKDYEDVRN